MTTFTDDNTPMPHNVAQQAEMLIFYLGLPGSRQRHGEDVTASIQMRLAQLVYSITPEEAMEDLWKEVQFTQRFLKGAA